MDQTAEAYEQLIERFIKWAQTEKDIRAAIVIGSRARVDHPADEWSDLDIVIITTDPERYWSTTSWIEKIGNPWLTFVEPTPDGRGMERRVLFEGGLDVDFNPMSVDLVGQMVETEVPSDVADTLRRGMRVLLDKDGLSMQLGASATDPQPPQPPTQHEFLEVVNDFWYHAVWTAKHLRRGELWWAKSGCDSYLKWLLLRMMEWHARATKGQNYDTWLRGRFLEEWADPRALEGLPEAFAHYDEDDIWRALFVTMDLFRWLSVEAAEHLGHSYPTFGDERATELVKGLFSEQD
jgi:aminoglycoside 6-adenylyltransferase